MRNSRVVKVHLTGEEDDIGCLNFERFSFHINPTLIKHPKKKKNVTCQMENGKGKPRMENGNWKMENGK